MSSSSLFSEVWQFYLFYLPFFHLFHLHILWSLFVFLFSEYFRKSVFCLFSEALPILYLSISYASLFIPGLIAYPISLVSIVKQKEHGTSKKNSGLSSDLHCVSVRLGTSCTLSQGIHITTGKDYCSYFKDEETRV